MKKIWAIAAFLLAALMLTPLTVLRSDTGGKTEPPSGGVGDVQKPAAESAADSFRVLISDTGEIEEMTAEDYICGVVAAEMPALYESEALKAQAIAAYTFACRRRDAAGEREYDISTDHTVDQSYMNEETLRSRWGDDAETYLKKIHDAVTAVSGYMVTYDGAAALTVYHAISGGMTEAASEIWGGSVPYLTPVESEGDRLAQNYMTTVTLSAGELSAALSELCTPSGDPAGWIGTCERTPSGTVKQIAVSGTEITGSQLREALSLRSTNFEAAYRDGAFVFTVYGYGHGVGMSQNGANFMAQQGSGFEEILCWYYPGCRVERVK